MLANKLLPAVKRYAVGTEPVREAAKARRVHVFDAIIHADNIIFYSFGPPSTNKQPRFVFPHSTTIRR